jgi:hypothetical protein
MMTPPRLFLDNLIFKRPLCCDPAALSNAATRTLCIVFFGAFHACIPCPLNVLRPAISAYTARHHNVPKTGWRHKGCGKKNVP